MENKQTVCTAKNQHYLFTSEVVSPGHPDKCDDIIADSIVDRLIIGDSKSRVASEVFVAVKHISKIAVYPPDFFASFISWATS